MYKLIAIFWEGTGISFHRNWHEAAQYKADHHDVAPSGAPYDIPVTQWLHDKVMRGGDWMSGMLNRKDALDYCPVRKLIAQCTNDAKLLAE